MAASCRTCIRSRSCLPTVGTVLLMGIGRSPHILDEAHTTKLRSINVPHFQKEFLIFLRLIVRVRPWEELIRIIFEMHRNLAEDAVSQIYSVIKILGRGENDFSLLDIAGIEIHRAFHLLI